ncbi:inter-alpha-trypsin inhibitor heavy chain H4-like [Stylophora pistillata]|uniref:Inter-alpha-trypsin inhibitor heavy chain H4 n=1 Tax=Stylophora pistillata TaxID=50429 RepID=A0A2B4SDJ3_STYPI|nr:inter-alpha-trypsin inhibitor heavy chain H4-like [Stylophora pistillata]PFX27951.1 Inter-alpha-trypsin inhibitor heavy chain H4 [Stylophora pistillata]
MNNVDFATDRPVLNTQRQVEKMALYFVFLCVFLGLMQNSNAKIFTADFDQRLNRERRNEHNEELIPLSLLITSKISSRFANTLVTSTLQNKSPDDREAKFVVQLPETAFISNFSMVVKGKRYIARVKEKNAAKMEYEEAKNKSLNTGLVSYSKSQLALRGMDVFEIAINVAPRSTAVFYLNYQQLLLRRKGFYEQTISIRPKQIVPVLNVTVDVEEPQDLSHVEVMKIRKDPSDVLEKGNPSAAVTQTSPKSARVTYNPSETEQRKHGNAGVDGDLIIQYDVHHENNAGVIQVLDSFFVQYFSPSGLNPLPKNVVFVIDISGSMQGQKIEQTRQAMFTILSQLRSDDSFNIVLFNGDTVKWRPSTSLATGDNIQAGKNFVIQSVKAGGSTNINDALLLALNLLGDIARQGDSLAADNFPMVLFLTDGEPTAGVVNGQQIRANILEANTLKASVFSLGFGFNLNMDLLTALSAENGGAARRIYPDKDAASQLEGFFDEISTPLLVRVRFEYPQDVVDITQVTATEFSQYNNGSELVVSGKLKEGLSDSRLMPVNVRGISSIKPVSYSLTHTLQNLTVSSDEVLVENFPERLWAYMKIKELLLNLLVTENLEEKARLKSEALNISLKYKFVTPLTSFVVVESDSYLKDDNILEGTSVVVGKGADSRNRATSAACKPQSTESLIVVTLFLVRYSFISLY